MAAKGMALVKNDPKTKKYYDGLIGQEKTDAIKDYGEYSLNQLWIQMQVTLSDQRKREVMANLKQAQTPGRDGSPAMTSEEGLVVTRFLEEDNIELAELYMNDAIRRHNEEVQANLMRAEQANIQGQQQSALVFNGLRVTGKYFQAVVGRGKFGLDYPCEFRGKRTDGIVNVGVRLSISVHANHVAARLSCFIGCWKAEPITVHRVGLSPFHIASQV